MQEGRIFPLGAVFPSSELHTCRGTDNEVARQTLVTLIFLLGPGTLQISILAPFSTEPRQVSHAAGRLHALAFLLFLLKAVDSHKPQD